MSLRIIGIDIRHDDAFAVQIRAGMKKVQIEATAQMGETWRRITVVAERKNNPTTGKFYCHVLSRQVDGGRIQTTETTQTS